MDQTTKMLSRLIGIAFSGAFAWSMIDLVRTDRLKLYLAQDKFTALVFGGGILLGLAVLLKIRAIVTGTGHSHDHDHDHAHGPAMAPALSHAHAHAHGHADHSHDHGETGVWRFFVLAFPLMFIFLNLVPEELSAGAMFDRSDKTMKEALGKIGELNIPGVTEIDKDKPPLNADWKELEKGRTDAGIRAWFAERLEKDRRTFAVSGQYFPKAEVPDRFHLMVKKMTCCVQDTTTLGIIVIDNGQHRKWETGQWIQIIGVVTYVEVKDPQTNEIQYFPVIHALAIDKTSPKPYITA